MFIILLNELNVYVMQYNSQTQSRVELQNYHMPKCVLSVASRIIILQNCTKVFFAYIRLLFLNIDTISLKLYKDYIIMHQYQTILLKA